MLNLNKHTNTQPKPTLTLRTARICVYHCVQLLYTTQHKTALMICPLILQTISIDWLVELKLLRPTQHKTGNFGYVPQANLLAWYGKI